MKSGQSLRTARNRWQCDRFIHETREGINVIPHPAAIFRQTIERPCRSSEISTFFFLHNFTFYKKMTFRSLSSGFSCVTPVAPVHQCRVYHWPISVGPQIPRLKYSAEQTAENLQVKETAENH